MLFIISWIAAILAYLSLSIVRTSKLPIPDMQERIVQHRVYNANDTQEHRKSVLDPEAYKIKRKTKIQPKTEKGRRRKRKKAVKRPATEPKTTGAFANCTKHSLTTSPPHPDQHNLTLSCHNLPYRIPHIPSSEDIMVGVLSMAGGEGPIRRQSIRETWAKGHSVFFLVAGPWENIKEEYDEHHDLIWIDEEEVYDGEKSVLTYKTLAFVKVVHHLSESTNLDIQYAFKTDDDSYVQVDSLHKYLLEREHGEYNYWGWCPEEQYEPKRENIYKWAVSHALYPELIYPRYCQGTGFALSRKFIDCAAGPGNHIADARFMPFEDVAMGLIAERCGIIPTMVEDPRLIHMYRIDSPEERKRVKQGLDLISRSKLPIPDMEGRIVQHRIYDANDMREHHKSVLDLEGYKESTDISGRVRK